MACKGQDTRVTVPRADAKGDAQKIQTHHTFKYVWNYDWRISSQNVLLQTSEVEILSINIFFNLNFELKDNRVYIWGEATYLKLLTRIWNPSMRGWSSFFHLWDKLNDKPQIYLTWSSLGRVLYDLFYNSCLPLINLRSSWNSATGLLLFNNILKRLLRIGMACGPLNGGAATTLVLFRQWNWAYLTQLDSVCCTTKLARWVVTTRNLEA